jgi:hypothetical protein
MLLQSSCPEYPFDSDELLEGRLTVSMNEMGKGI